MSEYNDALMLSKTLERIAAQAMHLKEKIDAGLEIPSWAEYKVYSAYDGIGKALGTAYPGRYGDEEDEEKMAAAFTPELDRHPALKGGQSRLPDKIQAGIIKKKLQLRKEASDTDSRVLAALSAEGGAAGMSALKKRVSSEDLQDSIKRLIAEGKVRRHVDGDLIKESGVLPEFLEKPRRDGFIDPREDDFSKNQAFGRAVGIGLMPVTGGAIVASQGARAAGAGIAGAGLLAGYGMYLHKLRQFRELQAQGKNPVTGKMHDPEKIEKTRQWAQRLRKGDVSAQKELEKQVLEDLEKDAAATATKTDPQKWEAAKAEAKAKMGGKHSARAMQLATQIYKKDGGGYSGAKPTASNNSLKKWTKQDWNWTGGDKPGQGGRGVYLPEDKADRLRESEEGKRQLASAARKKREATRKGEQYSSHGLAANTSLRSKK